MSYILKDVRIDYEEREYYLYAHVSGPKDTYEISLAYWEAVAKEAAERGFYNLMVVEDFPNQASVTEMFRLGISVAKLSKKYKVRVAFIDDNTRHFNLNEFAKIVAANRGVNAAIFSNIEKAEVWLKT